MRLRVEYRVEPDLKFLANLDMLHLMERSLRRAGIKYYLSEGFNPHIRLYMGTVLPVGLWGEKEYFDLDLSQVPPAEFQNSMNDALPPGISLRLSQEIPPGAPSLMKVINSAEYAFKVQPDDFNCAEMAARILEQKEILVRSRGKNKTKFKDLRPGLYRIEIEPSEDDLIIKMLVSINEPLNIRFDEILDVFTEYGLSKESILDFWRLGNYIKKGDKFLSPMEVI